MSTPSPEYRSWAAMWSRCRNPRQRTWHRYGGRGIAVCERWRDFATFLADMGPRPSPQHSLDRIDNDGNYEPGNCRWATPQEQTRNTRRNLWVAFNGERVLLIELAEKHRIPASVVYRRLAEGWSVERAVTTPQGQAGTKGPPITVIYRGRVMRLPDACKLARLRYRTVYDRLRAGWDVERALSRRPWGKHSRKKT